MSNLRRVVCLTVASAAMFPGAALAATWSPSSTIYTAPGAAENSTVLSGVDAAGTETIFWIADKYYSATKPAGGSWTAPTAVDLPPIESELSLSVGASGHAILSWSKAGTGVTAGAVQAVTRTPAGVWSPVQTIRTDTPAEGDARNEYAGDYAAGPDGSFVGASVLRTTSYPVSPQYPKLVTTALRPSTKAAGGSWATGSVLESSPTDVEAAVDGQGNATLLYRSVGGLKVVTKPASGSWGTPVNLVPSGQPDTDGYYYGTSGVGATLSVNASGQAAVNLGGAAFRRSADGTWGPLERFAAADAPVEPEWNDVQVDASGRATALWTEYDVEGHTSKILTSTAAAGGAWTPPTPVAPTVSTNTVGWYSSAHLAVAGSGKAVVSFKTPSAGSGVNAVAAAVRESGNAFEPAVSLSPALGGITGILLHSSPQVLPSGEATVVWPEGKLLREAHVGGAPTPTATPTPVPTASPAPISTPTATPKPTPTATPSPSPMATPTPAGAPSITSVGGFAYGWLGGIAIINGKNFSDVTSVKFGAKKASTGFAVGTGVLVVVAPAQEAGTYPVVVESKAGASASASFAYKRLF